MQPLTCALGTLLVCVVSAERTHCKRDLLEDSFGYIPDAWQLIATNKLKFHLMFISNALPSAKKYSCLTTLLTETVKKNKWARKIIYCTYANETRLTAWSIVGSRKARTGCSVYDNLITVSDQGKKKPQLRSRLLYSDYKTCIILWSQSLGYQVWAEKKHVETHHEIPYLCVLLYELYAGLDKHWVYDWDVCPKLTSSII
uniref:Lipocalin/cytosolic fatty-acid binding domain-containing protein n=1 Tax=Amblyomma maculatum TaxID=34609 RepID=G3MRR6_AMBMU